MARSYKRVVEGRPQGEAKLIIPDIEPWQIVAEGRNVWVATIANGLWASEDGQPFEQVSTGSVTAISRVGSAVWMALPTGELVDVHTQRWLQPSMVGLPVTSLN